jgi:radical SAM superfamily enzyme YgiQ (UPF0313 family)
VELKGVEVFSRHGKLEMFVKSYQPQGFFMRKDMKILFLYPNKQTATIGGNQPLGVASLAGVLKDNGYNFDYYDTTFILDYEGAKRRYEGHKLTSIDEEYEKKSLKKNIELFLSKVDHKDYDVLLVSAVTPLFNVGVEFAKAAKKANARIFTIFGGIHATVATEEVIANPYIDAACVGEGEEALIELLDFMTSDKDFEHVRNFWFKKKDGTIIRNPIRPYVDLDSLPYPDYSIFEERHFLGPFDGKVYRMVQVETSRGCPYRCSFCVNKYLQNLYSGISRHHRRESLEKAISKLEYIKEEYKPAFLRFVDESFTTMNVSFLEKFAEKYTERIDLPFWIQTSAAALNEKKVQLLKKMNCVAVTIGVEHGNENFRKTVLKKEFVTDERIFNAMALLKKYDLRRSAYFMIALPFETRELVFDTIRMYKKLISEYGASPSSVHCFYPFPGTELLDVCLENGFITKDKLNIDISVMMPVLDMPSLSCEEATALAETFYAYSVLDEKLYPLVKICEEKHEFAGRILKEISKIYSTA